jgi:hypothetical protein
MRLTLNSPEPEDDPEMDMIPSPPTVITDPPKGHLQRSDIMRISMEGGGDYASKFKVRDDWDIPSGVDQEVKLCICATSLIYAFGLLHASFAPHQPSAPRENDIWKPNAPQFGNNTQFRTSISR